MWRWSYLRADVIEWHVIKGCGTVASLIFTSELRVDEDGQPHASTTLFLGKDPEVNISHETKQPIETIWKLCEIEESLQSNPIPSSRL
jgi:hypothetical protein